MKITKMIADNFEELCFVCLVLTFCVAIIGMLSLLSKPKYIDNASCKNGTVQIVVETDTEKKVVDTGMRCDD